MNRCLPVFWSGPKASHSLLGLGGLTSPEVLEGNRYVFVCATTCTCIYICVEFACIAGYCVFCKS